MKKIHTINSYYQLGTFLIEIGTKLQKSPDEELEYIITIKNEKKSKAVSEMDNSEKINNLALQIKESDRDVAKEKLLNLNYKDLIKLCKILSISTSGKKKKDEIINKILNSLFDTIEGHRLIRDFNQKSD